MKKVCFVLTAFFSLLSTLLFSQDSNIVHAPYKVLGDSELDSQIFKLMASNHHQFSIVYVRINGFSKHISYYTIKEIDSGVFYCKNDLGYSHLLKLNGEKVLVQGLPEGQNYYVYRKSEGTDVMDEILINTDNNKVTLFSANGEILELLSMGKCDFYANKKLFLDIQNNFGKKGN